MRTRHHVCLSVSGALKNFTKREYESAFPDEPNWKISKKWLQLQEFEGKKVIPFGEACDGFSYETGCPGHPIEDSTP